MPCIAPMAAGSPSVAVGSPPVAVGSPLEGVGSLPGDLGPPSLVPMSPVCIHTHTRVKIIKQLTACLLVYFVNCNNIS